MHDGSGKCERASLRLTKQLRPTDPEAVEERAGWPFLQILQMLSGCLEFHGAA